MEKVRRMRFVLNLRNWAGFISVLFVVEARGEIFYFYSRLIIDCD